MKVQKPKFRRSESLRIKVLRKTVNINELKRNQMKINLKTRLDEAKKLIDALTRNKNCESQLEENIDKTPKTPRKKNVKETEENQQIHQSFNYKMIATSFMKKFGIERKVIEPITKNSTGLKSGKNGGKFIYF